MPTHCITYLLLSCDAVITKVGKIYKLKLASNQNNQPAGWYLDAHRTGPKDRRNDLSSYAMVHKPDKSIDDLAGEFELEAGSETGTFKIKLASSHHGPPQPEQGQ